MCPEQGLAIQTCKVQVLLREVLPPPGCAVEKLFGRASSKPECLALNKGTFLACVFFEILFAKPQQFSIKTPACVLEKGRCPEQGPQKFA